MTRPRLAILLSGRGSNFLALHRAVDSGDIEADIALVLSNIDGAPGLDKARDLGLPVRSLPHRGMKRAKHEELVLEVLREADVDWLCLAGYLRLLGPGFVNAYRHRIVNIHPSLLPAFPGLDAQGQAFEYGVKVSGCTVHLVDDGMDTGPIVMQEAVSADGVTSAGELSARILEAEHRLYPAALARLLSESWRVEGRRVLFD
ncbi:MAG: phosphoribosylglycinamide formyltransferase [Acidobacteriota bacterium]